MKTNKKLFIGLLVMSAFLGSCISISFGPPKVKDIPFSYFEENRGEGERLVYVTVERADGNERGLVNGETSLYIVTDNAAIESLTAPYTRVTTIGYMSGPSVRNSIIISARGLAVFSLPKSQENIGFAYFSDTPTASKDVAGGVTTTSEIIYSNGHSTYKIDPRAGDIAIRVILKPSDDEAFKRATSGINDLKQSPSGDGTFRVSTLTSNSDIQQMVSGCNQYGSSRGTGTLGFIAAPAKEKK